MIRARARRHKESERAMRNHTITDADMERMHGEMIETLVASGPSRTGQYKRILLRVRYDGTLSWVVMHNGGEIPYTAFVDAVEAYNEL